MEPKTQTPTKFFPNPIILSALKPGEVNVTDLGEGVKVVVIPQGERLQILRDLCPHMGAPLSEGVYRRAEGTLECAWHGYVFGLGTCELLCNPNEKLMAKLRQPSAVFKPEKTPKYRLSSLAYKIDGDKAYVYRRGEGA